MYDYWHKQTKNNPKYPGAEWEKPERKDLAGKLLIVGGCQSGFRSVVEAYNMAQQNDIGEVKVVIPESLRKITKDLPNVFYAPANGTGSFSLGSADILLNLAQWADGVLLCGDYGRNSETAIVLSSLARSYKGLLTITKDAIDILNSEIINLMNRPDTTLVCNYGQLQKITKSLQDPRAFLHSDSLVQVVEHLHEITISHCANIITKHIEYLITASNGEVTTNERSDLNDLWSLEIASRAAVALTHHKNKNAILPLSSVLMT